MSDDAALALLGPWDQWSLPGLVRRQAARFGARRFITFGDGPGLSFADVHARADHTARALSALGVVAGDRVFAMLRNRVEHLDLLLGCGRIGAVYVPVNTELKGWSLQHQWHNGAPRVWVVDADLLGAFDSVEPPDQAPLALVVPDGVPATLPAALAGVPVLDGAQFLAGADRSSIEPRDPQPGDIGCIMYTSGTTGPAKGVLMPHAHLALFSLPAPGLALTEHDVYYVCMPLFHANALFVQVFAALVAGAQVHCVARYSPNRWLAEVRACGATVTNLLGAMTEMLHRTPQRPDDADNPVRALLAVPVADAWIGDFSRRFGLRVAQGFGMTECNMIAYTEPGETPRSGCAGRVRDAWFEVAVVDPDTDRALPPGEVGEIVIRPRLPFAFMQGYHGMPERTLDAWRNLWFHTGDAGRIDAERRLHFVDRIKDRIRRRGENVPVFEVEQALLSLPGVAECAVVGVRVGDAGAEQEVMACIVRASGSALTAPQVLQHAQAHVPRFALPRFIEFCSELPRTASGKLRKQALRDGGIGPQTWDRERDGAAIERVPTPKVTA